MRSLLLLPIFSILPVIAHADFSSFTTGPVIEDYGPVADIDVTPAVHDVSGETTSSSDLIAALIDHGVRIIVCGQSAAYYDVRTDDLLPDVEMALSAMTAHALLQQQGYTLNPF